MRRHVLLLTVVIMAAVAMAACTSHAKPAAAASKPLVSALSVAGRGASAPFIEYEAEAAHTTGTVIGPSRTFGQLAAEASGREAVTLTKSGQFIDFQLTAPANAIDVRYSIPDSTKTVPLAVYGAGNHLLNLSLTSTYSWFYGDYPFTNTPSDGKAHHFYDDSRALLPSALPAGTHVRLVSTGTAPITIDLADFESVAAPITEPANAISVVDYGADPSGAMDSGAAFTKAIAAGEGSGKAVWIPAGTFQVNKHVIVDNVTLRGAGPWYSVLTGAGVGVYGNYDPHPSRHVTLADFAIFGTVTDRDDNAQVNGVGGALGGGSVISDLWITHTKVGMWFDGPFDGLTISGCRIQDTTADGINLHDGISHVTIENNFIRNIGDDGLALWSDANADHDDTLAFNTVELPMLANAIAIYGGRDNAVTDDVVADTLIEGGGLHAGTRFGAVGFAGTTAFARDTALRTGSTSPSTGVEFAALFFYAHDSFMSATINVTDTELIDSTFAGVAFVGKQQDNIHLTNVTIRGTGTYALQSDAPGSVSLDHVTATGLSGPILYSCAAAGAITFAASNGSVDLSKPVCSKFMTPVYHDPGALPSHSAAPRPSAPSIYAP